MLEERRAKLEELKRKRDLRSLKAFNQFFNSLDITNKLSIGIFRSQSNIHLGTYSENN